jgi:hypothetical protein
MDLSTIGRWMMVAGGVIFMAGLLIFVVNRLGLPIGRLPGDFRIEGENFSFYFPLATSILISLGLTLLLNLLLRWWKR